MTQTTAPTEKVSKHTLPPLPYDYVALEPHIDAETMQIHHDKHHQAYVTNLNAALDKHPELYEQTLEELLRGINRVPDDIRTAVRNNSGGHHNHSLFWTIMAPAGKAGGGEPSGTLADAIKKAFGGFAPFKEQLSTAGTARFGSGWAWLAFASGSSRSSAPRTRTARSWKGRFPCSGSTCGSMRTTSSTRTVGQITSRRGGTWSTGGLKWRNGTRRRGRRSGQGETHRSFSPRAAP